MVSVVKTIRDGFVPSPGQNPTARFVDVARRLIIPDLFARVRIQCDHTVSGRHVHNPCDDDRRCFRIDGHCSAAALALTFALRSLRAWGGSRGSGTVAQTCFNLPTFSGVICFNGEWRVLVESRL